MPLSEQERRCVELTCQYLNGTRGGRWKIDDGPTLDEQYPSQPSPEVLVHNESMTAAIEVKYLTGDSMLNEYRESIFSLRRFLVPPCGGHYTLDPCIDFRLPIRDPRFRKHLRQEIARVAPLMMWAIRKQLIFPDKRDFMWMENQGRATSFAATTRRGT